MSDEVVKEEVQEQPTAPTPEEPKFTQADLDRISTDSRNKGQRQALKELGYEDPETAKKELEEYKKFRESQKTAEEKLKGQLSEKEKAIAEANAAREDALLQLEAVKMGISPDKAEKALKLAKTYEGETAADRLTAMLEDFPDFKTAAQQGPPNISAPVKGQAPSEKATEEAKVRAAMGL